MKNEIYNLSVMITSRDRLNLTLKCIDSIWLNSSVFHKINIYLFDNLSEIDEKRSKMFFSLLESNKICYYSYDTINSSYNCFSKAVSFFRWCEMMKIKREIQILSKTFSEDQIDYFLLLDNDFILCPTWGEYFISAIKQVKEKNLHFLVPRPGGIPTRYIEKGPPPYVIRNLFDCTQYFKVKMAGGGGSSGFWFMGYDNLMRTKWDVETLVKTYNLNKRHDTETWDRINRIYGKINYVGAIFDTKNWPLALHLGSQCGSVCNSLTRNKYNEVKNNIEEKDESFGSMSVQEIIEMYKDSCHSW